MQFLKFFYFLTKTWTIILNSLNFFPFSKNMDYHIQFLNFLYFLTKNWTIICILWNLFPCTKNMDYHMQFFEISLLSNKNVDYHIEFLEFLSLLQKHGLSYAFYGISYPSKTWIIICNF